MLDISKRALEMFADLGGKEGFVRIEVKSGGCAGMTYDAFIIHEKSESDNVVFEDDLLKIIADPSSLPYLEGLAIDYSDDLISAGFRFSNSSNESSCGCGASFTVSGFPQPIKQGASCG